MVGNKGGLGASFCFQETSLCFVNSHLAAHQEKFEERNRMFVEIVKGLQLGYDDISCLNQFHHVIWLGDLNYRIDLPAEKVKQCIAEKNYAFLLKNDQLKLAIRSEESFQGFFEAENFSFPPTFKFHPGTENYNDKVNFFFLKKITKTNKENIIQFFSESLKKKENSSIL